MTLKRSAQGHPHTTSTVNAHQVTTATFADGTVEWVFWNDNILVAIYGPNAATTQPFVDGFLAATPA